MPEKIKDTIIFGSIVVLAGCLAVILVTAAGAWHKGGGDMAKQRTERISTMSVELGKAAERLGEMIDRAEEIRLTLGRAQDTLEPTPAPPGCAHYRRWAVTERYGRTDEHVRTFRTFQAAYAYLKDQAEIPAALEELRLFQTSGMVAEQEQQTEGDPDGKTTR